MVAAAKPNPMPAKLATAEDLAELADDARVEIIGGAFVAMAPPTFNHGDAQGSVAELLRPPFQRGRGGPGGWWLAPDVDIELFKHEVYRPDVVGWRRERVPERPDSWPVSVRPDWICEVLSPSTRGNDVGAKMATYHRAEVPHYWIVDHVDETLSVLRWAPSSYEVILKAARTDVVRAEPFDAIELTVADLFG